MNKFVTSILLILFATTLHAQKWTWQHPSPQGNDLNAVAFFDNFTVNTVLSNGTGFAVGNGGTILKTTNYGTTWAEQFSGTGANLYCICCSPTDSLRALAAGDSDTYTFTTDGGTTWNVFHAEDQLNSITSKITWRGAACFFDGSMADQVFLCGDSGYIVTATLPGSVANQALQFTIQYHSFSTLYSVTFYTNSLVENPSTGVGIAVGNNAQVLTTSHSGIGGWTQVSTLPAIPNGADLQLRSVCVNNLGNTQDGWTVGYDNQGNGYVWLTTNQGLTWSPQATSYAPYLFDAVACQGGTPPQVYAWTCANTGQVLATTTKGSNWNPDQFFSGNTAPLYGIAWTLNNGCIVGANGKIFTNGTNTGEKWVERDYGSDSTLNDICFIDTKHGFACGNSGAYSITTNGGAVWKDGSIITGGGNNFFGISFSDSLHGYASGNQGVIYITSNGSTWTQSFNNFTSNIYCVRALDDTTAWACADKGLLLQTTNAGGAWSQQTISNLNLVKVQFLNNQIGWILCANDSLYRTINFGATWQGIRSSSGVDSMQNDFYFADYADGWIAGTGYVARTTNGGTSWATATQNNFTPPLSPTTALNAIGFIDALNGWVAGAGGLIYYTKDGGVTWTSQISGTTLTLNAVTMKDFGNGWTAGVGGAILKFSSNFSMVETPRVLDFGKVAYQSSDTIATIVSNSNSTAITLDNPSLTEFVPPGVSSQFDDLDFFSAGITPNGSDSLHFRFSPVDNAPGGSRLRIAVARYPNSTAGANTLEPTITLIGNGAYSGLFFPSGTNLDFGDVIVGHCATQTLTVIDTGEVPVDISSLINSNVFINLSQNKILYPGDTVTLTLEFCPTDTGYDTASVTWSGTPITQRGQLTGHGIIIRLNVTPTAHSASSTQIVELDTICVPYYPTPSFTVVNTGNTQWAQNFSLLPSTEATISFLSGAGTNGCGPNGLMEPGDSCRISVLFVPNTFLNKWGQRDSVKLYFYDQDTDIIDSIQYFWVLTGASLNDTDAFFGANAGDCIRVGDCRDTVVTYRNLYDTLKLDNIKITGPDAGDYSWAPDSPAVLTFPYYVPIGGKFKIKITFCPTQAGDRSKAVVQCFYPFCPGEPDSNGNNTHFGDACGILNGFTLTPGMLNFGSNIEYGVGTPATIKDTFTLINYGAQTDTIIITNLDPNSGFTMSPDTIILGPDDTLKTGSVTFNPPGTGPKYDTLVLYCKQTLQTDTIYLQGSTYTQGLYQSCFSENYGALLVGASACDTCYFKNTGTSDITITSFNQSDASGNFSVTLLNGAKLPLTLHQNDSVLILYCFDPKQVGTFQDTVMFVSNPQPSPIILSGRAYVLSGTCVYLVPPHVSVDSLGNTVTAYIAMKSAADSIASFRASVSFDPSRLKFESASGVGGATGWTLNPQPYISKPGVITFGLSNPGTSFLADSGDIAEIKFTPYYGSALSTTIGFDQTDLGGFKFNVLAGQDSTNPSVSFCPDSAVITYDSICGLSVSNIVFQNGTFMFQNTPNPTADVANIQFQTGVAGNVTLLVTNALGVEVKELVNGTMSAGLHTVTFDVHDLQPGMYFYELTAPDKKVMRQMVVVK